MTAPPLSRREQARVLIPFALVTLIWGSTWLVIRGQLGTVPATWSVAYRFASGSAMMFAFSLFKGTSLSIGRRGQGLAILMGFSMFIMNFNFVYRAEQHITSGLVALVFALLVVPNALLGWLFFDQQLSRRFVIGSVVAIGGLVILFLHELASAGGLRGGTELGLGVGFTLIAVTCASIGNVAQLHPVARSLPIMSVLAWGMLWGALGNALFGWLMFGPPVWDPHPIYLAGVLYLGMIASAFAFTLYFQVIREIGAARAAYSSVLVPIIAMALSTIFESYRWSAAAAFGASLTVAGLVIALRARSPAR